MSRRDLLLLCSLFALALGLRLYDIAYPAYRWADERSHVPAASSYWERGVFLPDNWEHPPLRHLLLKGVLEVFGDGPHGWRMRNVLFGAAAAVLVALFAFALDGSRRTAALAGLLLAMDPLHVVTSRFTFEEVYGSAFFLGGLVLFLRHRGRPWWTLLSALLIGCAMATKWYYLPGWLILAGLALLEDGCWRRPREAAFVAAAYLLLPAWVYALAYLPWFGRGYDLGELLELTASAYHSLQSIRPGAYPADLFFLKQANALDWFVRPVMVGQGTYLAEGQGEFILYGNNLATWGLTLPAMALCGAGALRSRSLRLALPVLLFLATYLLFLFVRRPVFVYSAVPLLPYAFTATALATSALARRIGGPVYWIVLAVAVGTSGYLYPLVTAKRVPVEAYAPVLSRAHLNLH